MIVSHFLKCSVILAGFGALCAWAQPDTSRTADTAPDLPPRTFISDFTDTTVQEWYNEKKEYNPLIDQGRWRVSVWQGTGRNMFTLNNCRFALKVPDDPGRGYLFMTVRANSKNGAEIICTEKTHFGYYEARMKCSPVPGAVNAFFWIDYFTRRKGEEVDVEFLTSDFAATPGEGMVRCMLHPGNHGGPVKLGFNPAEGFHRYGFLWQPGRLEWTADGQVIQTITDPKQVPKEPGHLFFNNWTGSRNWGGGPPAADNTMIIDWCRFHPGATAIVDVPAQLQR
jgi:beta-glucanase (GH16 family)